MMPSASRNQRSTDVDIPTSGAGASCLEGPQTHQLINDRSTRSLAVDLLGLLVEWSALLDDCEPLDLQFLTGLIACCNPWRLLATLAQLLADNLAMLVLHKVSLGEPSLGLCNLAKEGMTFSKLGGDGLLLHGFHSFHGSHGLHGLHCLHR